MAAIALAASAVGTGAPTRYLSCPSLPTAPAVNWPSRKIKISIKIEMKKS